MAATYDLHLHSCWSYNALAVRRIYQRARLCLSLGRAGLAG